MVAERPLHFLVEHLHSSIRSDVNRAKRTDCTESVTPPLVVVSISGFEKARPHAPIRGISNSRFPVNVEALHDHHANGYSSPSVSVSQMEQSPLYLCMIFPPQNAGRLALVSRCARWLGFHNRVRANLSPHLSGSVVCVGFVQVMSLFHEFPVSLRVFNPVIKAVTT